MNKEIPLWRTLFGSIVIASILAIFDLQNLAIDKGFSLSQPKWLVLLLTIALTGIFASILIFLTWKKRFQNIQASYDAFLRYGEKLKWLAILFFILTLAILPFIALHPYIGRLFGPRLWIKFLLFLLLTFVGASLLRVADKSLQKENKEISWITSLLFTALAQLLVYQLVLAGLYITDYPFAIGWTRDSRYYYASLFFAKELYGQDIPLPILHPTLHFIFSIPFLFGKLPIWAYRAWALLLTLGLTGAVSIVLSKKIQNKTYAILFGFWIFLFLVQSSIYAHLLIPTLIIFIFVSPQHLKRSWFAILLASVWVGVSRINWFPVPAMLAMIIFFLDMPHKKKNIVNYLKLPAAWFIAGIATAFLSQAAYIQLSGNGVRDEFFTSLASRLIWERLLPGNTYAPGILGGALLLSAPLILLAFYASKKWDILTKLGVFSILFILFLGGLIVSVKIGGGADLHNMDAYFVSILLVGAIVFAREFTHDSPSQHLRGVFFFMATLLLAWFILRGEGATGYDEVKTTALLNDLQAQSTRVAEQGDEVLFISQRHLLAVGLIEDISLFPEYEKDVLMEMVMSQNKAYLSGFYKDLHEQRFGLIVIDPQKDSLVAEKRSFAAESNIWVFKVTRPLLCNYELLVYYESVGIELYVPRAVPLNCE